MDHGRCAEQLEFLSTLTTRTRSPWRSRLAVEDAMLKAAKASCDFYIENSAADGIPYWDTGAPNLHQLGSDYLERPADPINDWEPVDTSAAAIGAQGLIRLGRYLQESAMQPKANVTCKLD